MVLFFGVGKKNGRRGRRGDGGARRPLAVDKLLPPARHKQTALRVPSLRCYRYCVTNGQMIPSVPSFPDRLRWHLLEHPTETKKA